MSIDNPIPYLSAEVLDRLQLSTGDVIKSIEALIVDSEKGTVWSAPKAVILPDDGRYMMAALAAADNPPFLAVKTVVLNPRNAEKNLPQINGLVTMLDSETGLPVAILDGNWITAVRTAGLSAVAAKYMARKDSSVIAFIGCGVQAKSHLKAFSEMFPLESIRVFGRGRENMGNICELAESMSLKTTQCTSGENAIKSADIIVSSITYSAGFVPFLDPNHLKSGAFASITDLATPWVKDQFSVLNQLIIDDLKQEAVLPNKLVPGDFVTGDLSSLVLNKAVGRANPDDRNAFIFRGYALGDLALSMLAVQKAGEFIN